MQFCVYCGKAANGTDAFCTGCGMPFNSSNSVCAQCGNPINAADSFCTKCGTPASVPETVTVSTYDAVSFQCDPIEGSEAVFTLLDTTVTVDSSMDAFNYYRKQFSRIARMKANDLRAEYCAKVFDLDTFLINFPEMYQRHRKSLINTALDIICKSEIYDVSPEDFETQHTEDFCLCGEDINTVIESFNLTIEENQDRKVRMYNMLPGVIFSGIGGFVAALALNVAVTSIAEADIRNANVSPKQRAELYSRIDFNILMERAYLDYWRVFLSLTYVLNQRGRNVWYPNTNDTNRAAGLYQNLISGRVPQDKIASQTAILLGLNPYADEYMNYLKLQFGTTAETEAITDYFSA